MTLTERIVALHAALDTAGVPHAFGGALALAWCTQPPVAALSFAALRRRGRLPLRRGQASRSVHPHFMI